MSQTSYSINQAAAFAGMLGSDFEPRSVQSFAAQEVIGFGKFVAKGSSDGKCKLPAASTDVTTGVGLGVAMSSQAMPSDSSASASYETQDEVSVLQMGPVWVQVEDSVVLGGDVYVRHAAGGLGVGSFAGAAGAGLALLPGAKFMSAASANGLALVQLSLR